MTTPMSDEKAAYEAMKNAKEKFGTFHKTCFHIHTPESYDYKLLGQWSHNDYISASEQDIFDICIERKVLPDILTLDSITLDNALSCYGSKKEFISYLLLAETIIVNEIEVVLVSDHHTILGVRKLKTAIDELCKMKKHKVYPEVLLGIEILYNYQGEEFLIEMRMPVKPNCDDNILRCFGQNLSDRYHYRYCFNEDDVRDYAFKHFFKISKVIYNDDKWHLETVTDKREMLNHFFDVRYSVNDLVNTASGENHEKSYFYYRVHHRYGYDRHRC